MTRRILAAIDNSLAARPVLVTAAALAHPFGAAVDAVHVRADGNRTAHAAADALAIPLAEARGSASGRILECAESEDVVALVMGARGHRLHGGIGHVVREVLDVLRKPVAIVPPDADVPSTIRRVLVALSGSPGRQRSIERAIELSSDAGLDLVAVHVDDSDSIPRFSEQPQHETEAYATEFLARSCPAGVERMRLELRVGAPADEVLNTVKEVEPDLLVVGLPPFRAGARGNVAFEIVSRAPIAVLLVPLSAASQV